MRRIARLPLPLLLAVAPLVPALAAPPSWTPDQLRALLGGQGYTAVDNLQRTDGTWTADATRWGVPLHGITISAETGEVLTGPVLTAAQAATLLKAAGYTKVGDVREITDDEGQALAVHATDRQGRTADWRIDPWTGAVYPASDT